MPLYEYRCPSCNHRFELLRNRSADEAEVRCPACGSAGVERQVSTFSGGGACGTGGSAGFT